MGRLRYATGGLLHDQMAIIFLEVRDGKVVRQWDFVDYTAGSSEES